MAIFWRIYTLYIQEKFNREIKIMAEFNYGNLLSSVQKKIFPNGVAYDIMQRLDNMMPFGDAGVDNLDAFNGHDKTVEAKALAMFKNVDLSNTEELKNKCSNLGMKVNIDSVETKYVADAEQTGSVSVYTFTDRNGKKVSINNINAKEYIQQEQLAFDNLLVGVIDEVVSGKIQLPKQEEAQAA